MCHKRHKDAASPALIRASTLTRRMRGVKWIAALSFFAPVVGCVRMKIRLAAVIADDPVPQNAMLSEIITLMFVALIGCVIGFIALLVGLKAKIELGQADD